MKALTLSAQSLSDLKAQLGETLKTMSPTLAICFSDTSHDPGQIAHLMTEHNITLFGSTSAGEINQGQIIDGSIALILMEIDQSSFDIFFVERAMAERSSETGKEFGDYALSKFEDPSFMIIFSQFTNGEEIIKGLNQSLGREANVYGGMASDSAEVLAPKLYTNAGVVSDGFLGLIFDNTKVEISGFAISGWEAIGTEHTITKAKFNEILEINDQPALDFFIKFFGFYSNPDDDKEVATVNSQYPLQVMRDGDLVLRAPLYSDNEKRSLIMAGPVHEGEKFKFSVSPGFEVIDNTIREMQTYQEQHDQPTAQILFSCKARHWSFGPLVAKEVKALDDTWNIPFVGFFTFGEIGRSFNRKVHYFNETCCLVTISEK